MFFKLTRFRVSAVQRGDGSYKVTDWFGNTHVLSKEDFEERFTAVEKKYFHCPVCHYDVLAKSGKAVKDRAKEGGNCPNCQAGRLEEQIRDPK